MDSPLDVLELVFFSLLALLASKVVSGFANDRDVEQRRRRRVRARSRELALDGGALDPAVERPDQNV